MAGLGYGAGGIAGDAYASGIENAAVKSAWEGFGLGLTVQSFLLGAGGLAVDTTSYFMKHCNGG